MRYRLGFLALATVAVTGCGQSNHVEATVPDCSAVWVQGKVLPMDYDGCQAKTLLPAQSTPCKKQQGATMVWFKTDRGVYSALRGGKIAFLKNRADGADNFYIFEC